MAQVNIGFVGRGKYGERTFRVSVPNGHYDDVLGEDLDVLRDEGAPAHKLLRYADTEVDIKTGYRYVDGKKQTQTMPYKLISVISDTKDGLNFDRIGRNKYGFIQRSPTIVTEPTGETLTPAAADHSEIANRVPKARQMMAEDEFFSTYTDAAESFTTPDIPVKVQQELASLRASKEDAQKRLNKARQAKDTLNEAFE